MTLLERIEALEEKYNEMRDQVENLCGSLTFDILDLKEAVKKGEGV